jgi:hypothetical protein
VRRAWKRLDPMLRAAIVCAVGAVLVGIVFVYANC